MNEKQDIHRGNELGQYFRKIRRERKIKMEEIAPGNRSTVSRFETGVSNLRNERMYSMMAKLGMSIDDLKTHFPQYRSPFVTLVERLFRERATMSAQRLTELRMQYSNERRITGPLTQLNDAVLMVVQESFNRHQNLRLDADTQQDVQTMLLENDKRWLQYDYGLFILAAPHMDTDVMMSCYQHMLTLAPTQPEGYRDFHNTAISQVVETLLLRGDTRSLPEPLAQLEAAHTVTFWGNDVLTQQFLENAAHLVLGDKTAAGKQQELFNALSTLGLIHLRNFMIDVHTMIILGRDGAVL
jgi:transcriptional regulator with XRE-family HTH domain